MIYISKNINPKIHIGEIHGVYTLVDVLKEKDKYGHYIYKGVCNECGFERFAHYGKFSGDKSRTIKCRHIRVDGRFLSYGYIWTNKRIGAIFKGMVSRCYNHNNKDFKWYGAKGIRVCDEWLNNPLSFETWSLNNGYSDALTIDRINSEDNYSPYNCRWISQNKNSQQAGTVSWITVNDETLTGRQWASKLKLGINTINSAIRQYGIEKTKKLIEAMLQDSPINKNRKPTQSWFSVYGIQV